MPHRPLALALAATLALASGAALAHQTIEVGDTYRVTVGFVVNPAYAGQLNHLDLIVRTIGDTPEFVEGLAESLGAELITPDGTQRLVLKLRSVRNRPGFYTADFIPTVTGDYTFRVFGFIGAFEFDQIFDAYSHSEPFVLDPASISLPAVGR
jgi:hypothetical protein